MIIQEIQSILHNYNIQPELIIHLLHQGVELERLQCQINESIGLPNHEEMTRLLQGERFLVILTSIRFT